MHLDSLGDQCAMLSHEKDTATIARILSIDDYIVARTCACR